MAEVPIFVILDGGGVKGAALAGCIRGLDSTRVFKYLGFGGTSAGAIVSLLASVGYSGDELVHITTEEITFREFLDDGGVQLDQLKQLATQLADSTAGVRSYLRIGRLLLKHRRLLRQLSTRRGLYDAVPLQKFLCEKIKRKHPSVRKPEELSFRELNELTGMELKVLASDVINRCPVVFSAADNPKMPVIDAVRASMCYPFVFTPVSFGSRLLADGGLASNLPVFLFEAERLANRHAQVIAFDLVPESTGHTPKPGLLPYARDVLATALEASDDIVRDMVDGLHYVPVPIDASIDALDFEIDKKTRIWLADRGANCALEHYTKSVLSKARSSVEQVQSRYGRTEFYQTVLQAAVDELLFMLMSNEHAVVRESVRIRAHIMLPVSSDRRAVIYHANMDSDADNDLELPNNAGCSGEAVASKRVVAADLQAARSKPQEWGMTGAQANKVPSDLCLMVSIPIYVSSGGKDADLSPIGVFSVDTSADLRESGWVVETEGELKPTASVEEIMDKWSRVIGHMLTGRSS